MLERSLLQALTIARGDVAGLWASWPAALLLVAAGLAFVAPVVSTLVRRTSRPSV